MHLLLLFFKDFIYLFTRDTHTQREREAETQAEGEAGSCREPEVGLDPGSPGSRPEPKAGAKPLSHPGCPWNTHFLHKSFSFLTIIIYVFFLDLIKFCSRAAPVAQRFSAACSLGCDPGDWGSSPTSGSLHGACFSLCLCLCLSLSVSMNK